MKRVLTVLLALLLAAMLPTALAEDEYGYVDRITLEDGTELSVKVETKTDWTYTAFGNEVTVDQIPVYTVTVPEGTQNVHVYLTELGNELFAGSDQIYVYKYIAETDEVSPAVDEEDNAIQIALEDEHYVSPVADYGFAWEMPGDSFRVGAILLYETGDVPAQTVSGDVNGDGAVTVDDAILILRHVASLETLGDDALKAADVNADGALDVNDAIAILTQIAA